MTNPAGGDGDRWVSGGARLGEPWICPPNPTPHALAQKHYSCGSARRPLVERPYKKHASQAAAGGVA
jgi:hypothetical protein